MKIANVFVDANFLLYGNFLLARNIMINSYTVWSVYLHFMYHKHAEARVM